MATLTETLRLEPVATGIVDSQSTSRLSHSDNESPRDWGGNNARSVSRLRKAAVTFQLAGVNFASSATNGLVVVALPRMTADLQLPESLAFWPSSVPGLATASALLLAGAFADVVGPKSMELVGCVASGAMIIGCGFTRRGEELVALRALQGVAMALHLSSSVALITSIMPRGKGRNLSFACVGLSQPLGFSVGLVMGGVLVDTIGWRAGWYLYGGINLLLSVVGAWALPASKALGTLKTAMRDMRTKVDGVGALLASAFMTLISYFLAIISTDVYKIKEPTSIVLLCLGVLALPLFIGWMHRQNRAGKPALIPNSFWTNSSFATICATIALSFAVLNSLELFASLYFQEIQRFSALQAALRIVPSVVVGIALNFTTGLVVHKIPAVWLTVITSLLTAGSPLLMALIQPQSTYWTGAFFAQILMPFSVDVLFTVGLIIVTDTFPDDKQAIAGAVFNTASQFGNSLGLAVMQVVSTLVAKNHAGMTPPGPILEGYRAGFWTMLALMIGCAAIGGIGLRKTGKIGLKQE
ncbi:integral membrane protein [Purpureocillium lilacinum]|uniref:Integral membrane protein n=1 Tax=Purpureocillium lilacinum TaxID=33203 RepID=A0A179FQI8_PURLI|nr:integral membrane protein [Purpureocillium lilacinum]OAQ67480.1 integral membrane protein [Purpureocillium lilacinum]OAQ89703.1 integral membrane protein [Purpureocillium lilacinum]